MEIHFHVKLAPDPEDNQGVADLPRGYPKASWGLSSPSAAKPASRQAIRARCKSVRRKQRQKQELRQKQQQKQVSAAKAEEEAGSEADAETGADTVAETEVFVRDILRTAVTPGFQASLHEF